MSWCVCVGCMNGCVVHGYGCGVRECVRALTRVHVFTVVCGEQPCLGVCVRGVGMSVWCMGMGVVCVSVCVHSRVCVSLLWCAVSSHVSGCVCMVHAWVCGAWVRVWCAWCVCVHSRVRMSLLWYAVSSRVSGYVCVVHA